MCREQCDSDPDDNVGYEERPKDAAAKRERNGVGDTPPSQKVIEGLRILSSEKIAKS